MIINNLNYSSITYVEEGIEYSSLLCSTNDEEYLQRWIRKNTVSEEQALIMFGIGNGMYVKKFLSDVKCKGKLIVVEPSEEIASMAIERLGELYTDSLDRVKIVINTFVDNSYKNTLHNILSKLDISNFKVAVYPNYHVIFANAHKFFLEFTDEVADIVKASKSVDDRFSDAINQNIEINKKRIDGALSITALSNRIPKDIPVFIAASGPSLSKNVDELKRAKGKGLIVGLDSSLPALLAAGVIPDIYVSIDPTKIARHFQDERIKEIPVIALLQSPEHVIKKGQKYFFIFVGDEEVLPELRNNNADIMIVPPLGSVANTAFTMVNMMGFNRIVLVGQDLAYTGDKYHADNTVHDEKTYSQETVIYLKGIYEDEVKSSREFRMYKAGFEKVIEIYPTHVTVDATEGGAYINGTEVKKLSDVIDEWCTEDIIISKYFENLPIMMNRLD